MTAQPIPDFIWVLEIPTRAEDIAKREHNKFAKEAMRQVMFHHWTKTIPGHFERSAARKYKHKKRDRKYIISKLKKFGSAIDLVKTGRTMRAMTTIAKITVGGTAQKETLTGKLTLRFPFKGGTGSLRRRAPGTSTVKQIAAVANLIQMRREIEAWTPDERKAASKLFLKIYMKQVNSFRGQRKRIRIT